MKVHWIIPTRVAPGSGGTRTIVQVATELAERSHDVTISVANETYEPAEVQGVLDGVYGMRGVRVVSIADIPGDCDLMVATAWDTADKVRDLPAAQKAYFVQDFEPWFMPMGYDQVRARLSYTYGFKAITIGRWLSGKLLREMDMQAQPFEFGVDLSVYRPLSDGEVEQERAVCAVFQPEKPRRCVPLLLEAMRIVHEVEPDVRIYYYGSGGTGETVAGYPGEMLGVLSTEECNRLYNRCTVGMCLSASNPSRVPFEMMAAGLPVVDMHTENNLYDAVEGAELLAYPEPVDVAGAVLSLLANEEKRVVMSAHGVDVMSFRPLAREAACAASLLEEIARGETRVLNERQRSYGLEPFRAAEELREVARTLQETPVIVDKPSQVQPRPGRDVLGRIARKLRR